MVVSSRHSRVYVIQCFLSFIFLLMENQTHNDPIMHYLITDLSSHHVFLQAQLNAIRSFLYLHHSLLLEGNLRENIVDLIL